MATQENISFIFQNMSAFSRVINLLFYLMGVVTVCLVGWVSPSVLPDEKIEGKFGSHLERQYQGFANSFLQAFFLISFYYLLLFFIIFSHRL